MLDLSRIIGFDWDAGNERKSLDKHSVSQKEAESVFHSRRLLLQEDVKHSDAEARFQALGETPAKRVLHVTFTLRAEGTLIRVISARDVNAKERASYDKEA
jgi:uncharacterized DUF497 family protein